MLILSSKHGCFPEGGRVFLILLLVLLTPGFSLAQFVKIVDVPRRPVWRSFLTAIAIATAVSEDKISPAYALKAAARQARSKTGRFASCRAQLNACPMKSKGYFIGVAMQPHRRWDSSGNSKNWSVANLFANYCGGFNRGALSFFIIS